MSENAKTVWLCGLCLLAVLVVIIGSQWIYSQRVEAAFAAGYEETSSVERAGYWKKVQP